MPKVLDSYEFKASSVGHSNYDWDTLLDGQIYSLEEGEDFECKVDTMAMLVRKNAAKRGLKVKVSKNENGLVIQQVGKADPKKAKETEEAPKEEAPAAKTQAAKPAAAKPAAKPKAK
jgi:hypothetical protein